jgi:hypothetical protein
MFAISNARDYNDVGFGRRMGERFKRSFRSVQLYIM